MIVGRGFVLFCVSIFLSFGTAHSDISLPIGDINVVIVTDVHSWVAGHTSHEEFDVNYGHVESFVERLKTQVPNTFFVMNGDFMDGTGLSEYPPTALIPILQRMQWDALTFGNHDIYNHATMEYLLEPGGMVSWFGQRLVTSNVLLRKSKAAIGNFYRILKGDSADILAFGFLYNMQPPYSHMLTVEKVQETVQKPWFAHALKEETYDAIIVLAHMDVEDDLVAIILSNIRKTVGPAMPVQFITGHTHYRGVAKFDQLSSSVEAGHYLDTIGFVSFPRKGSSSLEFQHQFLDAKVSVLSDVLGVPDMMTTRGQTLADFIDRTRQNMGLTEVVGCSPAHFELGGDLDATNSLWGLYQKQVLPSQFKPDNRRRIVVQNKGTSLRYDLFPGNITVDDLHILNPFNESYFLMKRSVPRDVVQVLLELLNNPDHNSLSSGEKQTEFYSNLPNFILIGNIEGDDNATAYDVYTIAFDVPYMVEPLEAALRQPLNFEPVSTNIGATQLWFDFIRQEWSNCSTGWHLTDKESILDGRGKGSVQGGRRKNPGLWGFGTATTLALIVFAITQAKHRYFQHRDFVFSDENVVLTSNENRNLD